MKYLLDTNAVVAILKNNPTSVRRRLRRVAARGSSIGVSSIVLYELWYGVARSGRRQENEERLRIFLSADIEVLPFEEEDASIAGAMRAALESDGMPIGPYDLLIAAQAVRTGSTLVTANVSEFSRVRDLAWQDWAAEG